MDSTESKTDDSTAGNTIYFFDGLAKAPSIIQRAEEEIETLVGTTGGDVKGKATDVVELAKEGLEIIVDTFHKKSSDPGQLETEHAVKEAESIESERTKEETAHKDEAKEEIEKDSVPPKEEEKDGFWEYLGKWFENCCSPLKGKKD